MSGRLRPTTARCSRRLCCWTGPVCWTFGGCSWKKWTRIDSPDATAANRAVPFLSHRGAGISAFRRLAQQDRRQYQSKRQPGGNRRAQKSAAGCDHWLSDSPAGIEGLPLRGVSQPGPNVNQPFFLDRRLYRSCGCSRQNFGVFTGCSACTHKTIRHR